MTIFPIVYRKISNRDGMERISACFRKMLPVDSMEIYSFRQCFDRRVHSTVMQVRHALTWHLPVYLLMISHFFHVLHDSESTGREVLAAAFTRVVLRLRGIALEKNSNYSLNQRFDCFTRWLSPFRSPAPAAFLCSKHRSTPFNISLTTQPQSHATDKYFFNHVINTFSLIFSNLFLICFLYLIKSVRTNLSRY